MRLAELFRQFATRRIESIGVPALILAVIASASPAPISAQASASPTSPPETGSASAPDSRNATGTGVTLDVMTFNIRTAIGRDGDNVWPNRRELVVETIRSVRPHVLGLQEALGEQIEYLEEELAGYRWLGVDRGLNGGRGLSEATPLFYRYDELVPVESGTFWLSGDPDRPSGRRRVGRIVTWARFHHLETRRQIWVYNTHFTLRRGRRQVASAERINARIAELPAGSSVIVMGDFNAVAESSSTWDVATSEGLRDAWVIAEERQGPALTSNGFGPPPEGREGRIDWILVGGPVEVPSIRTVVHSSGGRYPSDHYPVTARIEIADPED